MSDNPKSSPVTRLLSATALAVCAILGVVAPAAASMPSSAAPASLGSVPSEVARFAAEPDGLLARLDDLFGVTTSGQGIEFDDTTKVGQLNRAWIFTEAWLGGGAADDPVELTNLWTAPITIADKPVGLATIWINTTTDAPDLADFDRSASSATALADVPAEAQLVRDEPRAAWFTLVEGQLTPLIAGDSGVDAATDLSAYQRTITGTEPPAAPDPRIVDGLLGAGLVAGAAVLVVLVVLLLPMLRRRAGDKDPDDGLSVSTAAITLPTKAELQRAQRAADESAPSLRTWPAAPPVTSFAARASAEPAPKPEPAKASACAKPNGHRGEEAGRLEARHPTEAHGGENLHHPARRHGEARRQAAHETDHPTRGADHPMRIAITGASGKLGTATVTALQEAGHEVLLHRPRRRARLRRGRHRTLRLRPGHRPAARGSARRGRPSTRSCTSAPSRRRAWCRMPRRSATTSPRPSTCCTPRGRRASAAS